MENEMENAIPPCQRELIPGFSCELWGGIKTPAKKKKKKKRKRNSPRLPKGFEGYLSLNAKEEADVFRQLTSSLVPLSVIQKERSGCRPPCLQSPSTMLSGAIQEVALVKREKRQKGERDKKEVRDLERRHQYAK